MTSSLDYLKEHTIVVADTGDFDSIKQYQPRDATTNPTLILKASAQEQYKHIIEDAIQEAKASSTDPKEQLTNALDRIFVSFGCEILNIVPGRVSTEVDARLSFDIEGSIKKGRSLIARYEKRGIGRERILIKLASTWEGFEAAKVLEQEGIHCNMTLLFSLAQAICCAEAKATLVSPFVGRILDWFKAHEQREYEPNEDPGVVSVKSIYHYYKKYEYKTEIMGASFRNVGEIKELAGCDLLTISPNLLEELAGSTAEIPRKLDAKSTSETHLDKMELDEKKFRFMLNEDQMATEKLSEGIRKFSQDICKLEETIEKMMKEV